MRILRRVKLIWKELVEFKASIDADVYHRFENYCHEKGFIAIDNCLEELIRRELEEQAETALGVLP